MTDKATENLDSDNENYSIVLIARMRVDLSVEGMKFIDAAQLVLELCNHDAYAFLRQRQLRDLLDTWEFDGGLEGDMADFIKLVRKMHPNKPVTFDVKVKLN